MKFKTFSSLVNFLNSIPNINRGGCGISALYIYEFLKEKDKNPEIYFLHDSDDEALDNNRAALEGKSNPVAPGHAVVKCDGKWLDSHGKATDFVKMYDEKLKMPYELVVKSLDADNWNSSFDREKFLPLIESATGFFLPKM